MSGRNYLNPTEVVSAQNAANLAATSPIDDETIRAELDQLLQLGRKYIWNEPRYREYLQDRGLNIEPARFYSQLPTVHDIESSFEFSPDFAGTGPYDSIFEHDQLERELEIFTLYSGDFAPPLESPTDTPSTYFWNNPAFSYSDAMSYWAAIRRYQPKTVVEIGSGFSSLVARDALAKNGHGDLVLIEPYPMEWLGDALPDASIIERTIQSFDEAELSALLSDGDILFIDSTHTVKIGSDCLAIYLRLLPSIDSDIHVHVHDINLPFPIPKARAHQNIHWAEQYLLMAYLLDNPRIDITYGSRAGMAYLPTQMESFMHARFRPGGGSLWFDQKARVAHG